MNEILNVSPTLIIGLGGTGSLALQYVKRKIRARLEKLATSPLPPQLPFVEYVVMDTILTEDKIEDIIPDEFMDIGRINISRALGTLRSASDESVLNWFPRHLDPGQIDSGAGGVRAIGRLCFFLKQSEIEGRIRGKVKKITTAAKVHSDLNEYLSTLKYAEGGAIDVHVVSSLCGGTGSACLLDTAYLVQHIIQAETKLKPNCIAHLVTTEPFENEPGVGKSSREYIQRNFAISVSEIEHFINNGSWDVEYRNGMRVRSDQKPFSLAYLLGYKDGVSLNRSQICEIIGETIAINCVHPDGKRIKGDIENHKPHVINTRDSRNKLRAYSSYNTQILVTDVDREMFRTGVRTAQITILESFYRGSTDEATELAFADFVQNVFSKSADTLKLEYATLATYVETKLNITEDVFSEAEATVRHTFSKSPRQRRKSSQADSIKVLEACGSANDLIRTHQRTLISSFKRIFEDIRQETDRKINDLINRDGLDYVSGLLEKITRRLSDIQSELEQRTRSVSDRKFGEEIAREIREGRSGNIKRICKERAESEFVDPPFDALRTHIVKLKQALDERKKWCDKARTFLQTLRGQLPEPERHTRLSFTTGTVWTTTDLIEKISKAKQVFGRAFLDLLEAAYEDGDLNKKVAFLPQLNDSADKDPIRKLLEKASGEVLGKEIEQYQEQMQQKAADKMHELVELASPAWQIERTGEDIATVAITNCPENSKAGQIISSFGKNISFSRNGVGQEQREIILFRSEHGVSVNHLSNLQKCLDAVVRKMQSDGTEKLADLCLDPSWNVAAPFPLKIEDLRLEFTLAIHFKLITVGFVYEFTNESGNKVEIGQQHEINKSTRRFEAFGRLMDLDRVNHPDCKYLRQQVQSRMNEGRQNDHIRDFRQDLSEHLDKLNQLIAEFEKPDAPASEFSAPEDTQLRKEQRALSNYIEELDRSIKAMSDNDHGPAN